MEQRQKTSRKIIHVDMDCFYAAVELLARPDLRGKPIAVGGSPEGRGVIATASYEARAFGVRSAMSSAKAVRLCPSLVLIRPNFARYKAESAKVRAIFERFASVIEPLSLDEAYLDVTECVAYDNSATRIAQAIRTAIREELGLTASAGIAPNKFLAKVASEMNKPDGQKTIRPSEVAEFVRELSVECISGVGRVTAKKMHAMGLRTCGDLQALSIAELSSRFGSWGLALHAYARGEDDRPVRPERARKSLSVERTYSRDLATLAACVEQIQSLYDEWEQRFQRARASDEPGDMEVRGIFVKLKRSDFLSCTREAAFSTYPRLQDFRPLLARAFEESTEPVRLIGLGVRLEADARPRNRSQLTFEL